MNWVKENWQKLKKSNLVARIKEHWIVLIITFLVMSIFLLPFWFDYAMQYFEINTKKDNTLFQWKVITGLGYAIGMLLLIMQISISNRRADASEKSAQAALKNSQAALKSSQAIFESNIEQRYHNAVSHLANESSVIRIGAIYNLYHISQSTNNTYDQTIFDMFCEYLRITDNKVIRKEKQIIVDKLFRVKDKRVFIPQSEFNLTSTDLSGINFSNTCLKNAILTSANLDKCIFDKTDLTGATLPARLDLVKTMKGVKLDDAKLYSGTNMSGLQLQPLELKGQPPQISSLKNLKLWGVNLSWANLTKVDLTGAIGLTFEQLSEVKCLYEIKGLDADIEKKLKQEKPKLFNELSEEKI